MTTVIPEPSDVMGKLNVRHERLPGIGDRFEFDTKAGRTVTVVKHRSGRRDLSLSEPGAEVPLATARLSRAEAVAAMALLTGLHIEVTTGADGLLGRLS